MQSKPKTTKKRRVDLSGFKNLKTAEHAYLLGLIATDGHITKTGTLSFNLQYKDKELIYLIKKILKSDHKPRVYLDKRGKKSIQLVISRKECGALLSKYGLFNNKTFTIRLCKDIPTKLLRFVILGVYDGDGGYSFYPRYVNGKKKGQVQRISLTSASKGFIDDIQKLLHSLDISTRKIHYDKRNKGCYNLYIKNESIIDFHKLLYHKLNFKPLKRKSNKLKQLVKYRKTKIKQM